MFYWLENSIRRWRRYCSRSEWAIRHLCLPVSENTAHDPGLLLIQIDGLSREQMERAMKNRRLPFLRSLEKRQHYGLHTFYSGIPSSTPSVQGELFYGVRCAVPGFSFLDRESSRMATMYKPDWAKCIEGNLKDKCEDGEPLLKGGSSWSNIYSGGADESETHFCATCIGPGRFFKSDSLFGKLGLMALHAGALLRLFFLLLVELCIGVADVIRGVYRGQNAWKEVRFLFSRIFICIGVREMITVGAKIDLARGLPIVHVNFLGYDEQSHCRGPASAYAHWSLLGIDTAIRNLYWAARRSSRRDYQVWIYSDHGQEAARSYAEHFPGGIEKTIADALVALHQKKPTQRRREQPQESYAHWRLARQNAGRPDMSSLEEFLSHEEKESFSVCAMGPLGNVYFAEQFSDEQKRHLAEWFVSKGKVPGVLFKTQSGQTIWIHAEGPWRLPEDAEKVLPHAGRLKSEVARDLVCLCENQYAGDLILTGFNPRGANWTFPMERGAHCGPGPRETQGFALLPEKTRLPEPAKDYLRPTDLRNAALHFLGRRLLKNVKSSSPSPPPADFRIMTYNVHGCLGLDGRISPHRIARVIENYNPDIVALQEIDLGRARSHWHDQSQMIADHLGMHFVFCPVVEKQGELYGHALYSRFPMEVVRSGVFVCDTASECWEPRGALLVRVKMQDSEVYILNTHLGVGPSERSAQLKDLLSANWLGSLEIDEPLIVCGDFNTLPGSFAYRALTSRLHDAQLLVKKPRPMNTFSSSLPFGRIDHVLLSGHFEVARVAVPRNHLTRIASDHLPLLVDLHFAKEALEGLSPNQRRNDPVVENLVH